MKKETVIRFTKILLDIMFFGGILVTAALPFALRFVLKLEWLNAYLPNTDSMESHVTEITVVYFVLGVLAIAILGELRKMFRTVLNDNCFVYDNVVSLQRMGTYSFMIALFSLVRSVIWLTVAMVVVTLVFVIAGLFSKVLAFVFDKAVKYKEENDLTI